MTKIGTLLILAMTAAACRSAPPVTRNQVTPDSVPRGYAPLPGPQACGDQLACGIADVRDVKAAGVLRIGVIARGLDATLAIETARGWFIEPVVELMPRRSSHHQPHSRRYDLAATRLEEGQLVVRLVDSQSVFYPGQGAVGSSHTSWFDRRCVVIDALVHCSQPVSIASQACTTERASDGSGSPRYKKSCTGGPPAA